MIWTIIIIALLLIFIRFLINFTKLQTIKKYYTIYKEYLDNQQEEFFQNKVQIIELFNEANLKDFSIQRLEPAGYGKLKTLNATGFQNIGVLDQEVVINISAKFNEAIGVFKHRMYQSLNPIFWIEFLFKLPQYFFNFLGILPESIVVKLSLVIYWLLALFLGLNKFKLFDELIK